MGQIVEVREADGPTLCGRRSDENVGVNSGCGTPRRSGVGAGDVDVGDEGVLRWFDPVAVFGDLRVDAKGAKNRHGAGRGFIDALDNTFADATIIGAAAFEEASSGSVAVNGGARGEMIIEGDGGFRAPIDEVGFDGIAVRMVADGAFAGVAFERGIGLATGGDLGFGRGGIVRASAFFAAAGLLFFLFDLGAGDERGFVLDRGLAGGASVGVASLIAAGEGFGECGVDDDLEGRDGLILRHGWWYLLWLEEFVETHSGRRGGRVAMGHVGVWRDEQ